MVYGPGTRRPKAYRLCRAAFRSLMLNASLGKAVRTTVRRSSATGSVIATSGLTRKGKNQGVKHGTEGVFSVHLGNHLLLKHTEG